MFGRNEPLQHLHMGVDIGLESDYTAIAVIEQYFRTETKYIEHLESQREITTANYRMTVLERLPLPTREKQIIDYVCPLALELAQRLPQDGQFLYVLPDRTGVGLPVTQGIMEALEDSLEESSTVDERKVGTYPVHITNGFRSRMEGGILYVPRDELISTAKRVIGEDRFRASPRLALAPVFEAEIRAFRPEKKPKKPQDPEETVWRERKHDDTVFAASMALWSGEQQVPAKVLRRQSVQEELEMLRSPISRSSKRTLRPQTP